MRLQWDPHPPSLLTADSPSEGLGDLAGGVHQTLDTMHSTTCLPSQDLPLRLCKTVLKDVQVHYLRVTYMFPCVPAALLRLHDNSYASCDPVLACKVLGMRGPKYLDGDVASSSAKTLTISPVGMFPHWEQDVCGLQL